MKNFILPCCLFCFFGFSMNLKSSPLELINSLKEEMNIQNREVISILIRNEVRKNENEISHLKGQLEISGGGKALSQNNRKIEIRKKIESLERENFILLKDL